MLYNLIILCVFVCWMSQSIFCGKFSALLLKIINVYSLQLHDRDDGRLCHQVLNRINRHSGASPVADSYSENNGDDDFDESIRYLI